jgi:hypothetical protein
VVAELLCRALPAQVHAPHLLRLLKIPPPNHSRGEPLPRHATRRPIWPAPTASPIPNQPTPLPGRGAAARHGSPQQPQPGTLSPAPQRLTPHTYHHHPHTSLPHTEGRHGPCSRLLLLL